MAAQPDTIQVMIEMDIAKARQRVKRVIKEAQDANRELAELEEKLDTLGARLRRFGIDLVIDDEGAKGHA